MMTVLNYALDRLSESSTWRGLTFLLCAAGLKLSPEHATAIVSAGMAIVGAINVFRKS
jgi:hypothetical protein